MSSNLSRGLQSKIDNTSIEDGKIRFAIDTARLFLDTASQRIEITDVVKGLTSAEISALENPLPKVYLSSDSHQILSYDFKNEKWITYGGDKSVYVADMYFNSDGNIVLVYGDGAEKVITSPVSGLNERIKVLEETLAKYTSNIEIIESNPEEAAE